MGGATIGPRGHDPPLSDAGGHNLGIILISLFLSEA